MKIVEVDGIWVEEAETDKIHVAAAQRYSVLVTMKNETGTYYPMMGSMVTDLFNTVPSTLDYNVTGWLVHDESNDNPTMPDVAEFDPYDDFDLVTT